MQNWTGKFCLISAFVLIEAIVGLDCATSHHTSSSGGDEVSVKDDQDKINELRKNIPEEIRKSNDRLGDMLKIWRDEKMEPERLRDKFSDAIRKQRLDVEKKHTREREDFRNMQADQRRDFQEKQKDTRDDFLSKKPTSEKRERFMSRQSEDRDRFNSDLHDARDEFEDRIKTERKDFESDIADRWSEFRTEFPEYIREYREIQEAKEKAREEKRQHPGSGGKPAGGGSGAVNGAPPPPEATDVNQGGDGWPASDPSEFNKIGH